MLPYEWSRPHQTTTSQAAAAVVAEVYPNETANRAAEEQFRTALHMCPQQPEAFGANNLGGLCLPCRESDDQGLKKLAANGQGLCSKWLVFYRHIKFCRIKMA